MKIKLFKKTNKFSHSSWTKLHPGLHWRIALYGFFTLVVASFAFGFYLFIKEDKAINSLSFDDTKAAVDTVSRDRIQKVLNLFSEREKKSAEIISNPPTFSDPSI